MKQISNKEYEKYQQYQTDKLHGRILLNQQGELLTGQLNSFRLRFLLMII